MSYKAMFAIAAALGLHIEQMDVKTAFLYGDIDGVIYVVQPHVLPQVPGKVCRLNKALYGLKQSPRIWYNTLAMFLRGLGFQELSSDLGIFGRGRLFIAIYVDDLLIAGADKAEIDEIKAALSARFQMSDLCPCSFYLGMSVRRDMALKTLCLGQKSYLEKVLRDFDMTDCSPAKVPMDPGKKLAAMPNDYVINESDRTWYASCVGSLMYAIMGTRPDIAFAVSCLSRYMARPGPDHITAAKRVLRYLKGTLNFELVSLRPLVWQPWSVRSTRQGGKQGGNRGSFI